MQAWIFELVVEAATQPLYRQCLQAGTIGLLTHLLYFIHWTKDTAALRVAFGHFAAFTILFVIETLTRGLVGGTGASLAVVASYLSSLFTSIVIYRVFFHRLCSFPGPFMARISKMYAIYAQRNGKMHEEYDKLLRQYGEFVRIAPNEILHISIDCMSEVHGHQAKCFKGNMYATMEYGPHRVLNLDSIVDKTEHRYRRQVWDKAFNGKALEAREAPVRATILEWLSKVDSLQGQPINWTLFASLISFDITGRVGFSVDFGGLRTGEESILQRYIQALFKNMADSGQLPWMTPIVTRSGLPLSRDIIEFEKLAKELVEQRLQDTEEKEDIIRYFIDDYRLKEPKSFFTQSHLECDAQAILIGAADSSFSPMTFCVYQLLKHPEAISALRMELETLFGKSQPGGFADIDLAHAEYLNAVLDETLRLYNPTCTNGPKQTPPEGIVLSDTYIPGNVALLSSIWSFHRSEKFFARPLEWLPERWTSQPELVLDKRAFHPFSYGPFNCVGRRMAMMTLRLVLAYTVWFCDMNFAPGETGANVEALSRDAIFLVPGPLNVVFTKRTHTKA